jgi:acetyl esterase/lipase
MIRLVILIILLLLSFLTLFKAPTYHLWLIAITVTEFSLLFSSITLIFIASGYWFNSYRVAGTVTGFVTLLLYLSPVFQAYLISKDLESSLSAEFGSSVSPDKNPFSFTDIFSGVNNELITYTTGTYTAYANRELKMDFYSAKAQDKRPCVIVIHGGSWKSGDNKQLPELNSFLAKSGYHVAAINYRLAPAYHNPLPVDDVETAIKYLKVHSQELNIDTRNIFLLGRSAGAQIALLAAYTLEKHHLKGVIDFYGPADMVWGYSAPANPLVMDSRKVMEDYLGGTYQDFPDKYLASSPIHFVSSTSIPTLIIHGENDVLVAYEHSRRLHKKLNENGVKNYFLSIPWATHGFDYTLNGPGGQLSTYAVLKFLNSVTTYK